MPAAAGVYQTIGIGKTPLHFESQPKVVAVAAVLTGVTRDSGGLVLPGCTVEVYDTLRKAIIGTAVSDANGVYTIQVPLPGGPDDYNYVGRFFAVAFLPGSPDVAGI